MPQLRLIYRCNGILPQIFVQSQCDRLNDYLFKFAMAIRDCCFVDVKCDQAVDAGKYDLFFKFAVDDSRSLFY